jgi:hypothetical protein
MNRGTTTSTTLRVSKATRDEVGALVAADQVTMDQTLRRLARAERQRRIGAQLAEHEASGPGFERPAIVVMADLLDLNHVRRELVRGAPGPIQSSGAG